MNATTQALASRGVSDLRKLADHCAALEQENADLTAKVASFEKLEVARKLASAMEDKGLLLGQTYDEKVASIMAQDVGDVRRAMDLAADGGVKIAEVSDLPGGDASSLEVFAHFCATGEALD